MIRTQMIDVLISDLIIERYVNNFFRRETSEHLDDKRIRHPPVVPDNMVQVLFRWESFK